MGPVSSAAEDWSTAFSKAKEMPVLKMMMVQAEVLPGMGTLAQKVNLQAIDHK